MGNPYCQYLTSNYFTLFGAGCRVRTYLKRLRRPLHIQYTNPAYLAGHRGYDPRPHGFGGQYAAITIKTLNSWETLITRCLLSVTSPVGLVIIPRRGMFFYSSPYPSNGLHVPTNWAKPLFLNFSVVIFQPSRTRKSRVALQGLTQ